MPAMPLSPNRLVRRRHDTLRRMGLAASAAVVLACEAVIGIEDITDHPRPDSLGAGGATAPVGAAGQSGGSSAGAGGNPSAPDGRAGSGSDNPSGSGGAAGTRGEPLGQAGTQGLPDTTPIDEPDPTDPVDGGSQPAPPGILVSGRVIDLFRRPVPGVPVSIADQTEVTDADGRFSISGVEAPYVAKLMLSMTRDGTPARYGYVYEGLERPDPTLQVYSALVQRAASSLAVAINQTDFLDPDRHVSVSFGSPDANFVETSLASDGTALPGFGWTGPAMTAGSAHAISVIGGEDVDDPPILYEAHQSQPLTAADDQVAVLSFDLPPGSLPESTVSGVATGGSTGDRSHYVAARFADGTALPLIDQNTALDDFDYLVPDLEETSLVVAAADGFTVPYAVAWREGVSPGEDDVELRIPNPVTLSSPQNGSLIDGATPFAWSTQNQTAQTFLFHLEFTDTYAGILVITSRSQIELPSFPDGFTVPVGTSAYWSVETHGDAENVDALASPEGFLDPFSIGTPYPVGPAPAATSGYYTESARSSLVMGN
jgi:hypothetical protein